MEDTEMHAMQSNPTSTTFVQTSYVPPSIEDGEAQLRASWTESDNDSLILWKQLGTPREVKNDLELGLITLHMKTEPGWYTHNNNKIKIEIEVCYIPRKRRTPLTWGVRWFQEAYEITLEAERCSGSEEYLRMDENWTKVVLYLENTSTAGRGLQMGLATELLHATKQRLLSLLEIQTIVIRGDLYDPKTNNMRPSFAHLAFNDTIILNGRRGENDHVAFVNPELYPTFDMANQTYKWNTGRVTLRSLGALANGLYKDADGSFRYAGNPVNQQFVLQNFIVTSNNKHETKQGKLYMNPALHSPIRPTHKLQLCLSLKPFSKQNIVAMQSTRTVRVLVDYGSTYNIDDLSSSEESSSQGSQYDGKRMENARKEHQQSIARFRSPEGVFISHHDLEIFKQLLVNSHAEDQKNESAEKETPRVHPSRERLPPHRIR